eukprot:TRINITY_DN4265_c0_g1_i3.p1 TRINITY_DN4265_c0_g1~~TRINITY_DN4265_c0_g1_i3.p1  ORF type:complete len:121 (+),score=23.60 TRINITY_DN4265_c0_g1_i3:97-459(+)
MPSLVGSEMCIRDRSTWEPYASKKPVVLPGSKDRVSGTLKFFDEFKKYGFIILDTDFSDIFLHFDDLNKAGIPIEIFQKARENRIDLRFTFCCMNYIGKHKSSRKAIDIELENKSLLYMK